MGKVVGIGGVFFKSEDPEKLKRWYIDNLGLEPDDAGYVYFRWEKQVKSGVRGYTLWGPFSSDTKYFDSSKKPCMVNFVVDDLVAVLDRLREKGVEVDDQVAEHEEGRFGWFMDPEGNKVELWQPPEKP